MAPPRPVGAAGTRAVLRALASGLPVTTTVAARTPAPNSATAASVAITLRLSTLITGSPDRTALIVRLPGGGRLSARGARGGTARWLHVRGPTGRGVGE